MKLTVTVVILFLSIDSTVAQLPFRYALKKVEGTIYEKNGNAVKVNFKSRRKLDISNCSEQLDTFLRTLALARHGRTSLEFLLTTSARVTVSISDKVGILLRDGKYTLIGGASGPEENFSNGLMVNQASVDIWMKLFNQRKYVYVYRENTIEIFKGSIVYANDMSNKLSEKNIKLLDWESNTEITEFSLDSITLEPIQYPDMLYKNFKELYYFVGLHEIFHLSPENIKIQEEDGDAESDAMAYETKAFKKRTAINKRKIKYPKIKRAGITST